MRWQLVSYWAISMLSIIWMQKSMLFVEQTGLMSLHSAVSYHVAEGGGKQKYSVRPAYTERLPRYTLCMPSVHMYSTSKDFIQAPNAFLLAGCYVHLSMYYFRVLFYPLQGTFLVPSLCASPTAIPCPCLSDLPLGIRTSLLKSSNVNPKPISLG